MTALGARIRWIGSARTSASAVAFSLVSRVAILVVNVATGIIVARTLGPAGRGAAAAMALWPIVISGLLTFGIPSALRYEMQRRRDGPGDFLSSALAMTGILGVLAFAIGFAIVPHILMHYPPPVIAFAQSMMVFAPLMLLNATLQAFYESQADFKRSNAMNYIPPLLTLAGLGLLHAANDVTPFSVALVYELPFALMTLSTLVVLRRSLRFPHQMAGRVRSLLHYGTRAYGIDILTTLAGQIDQAMVVGLLSAGNFGLYAVAVNGSRILSLLAASLNTVLFPRASRLEASQAVELVNRSARIVFACTSIATLAFILALPVLVPIAYGKEYSPIVGVTGLLSIAMLLGATSATFTQSFMATGRPEIATILQGIGICTTVPLMLQLIPRFGLTGAAYAVDISNALRFALVMLAYPLALRRPMPRLLLTRRDLRDLFGRLRRVPAA